MSNSFDIKFSNTIAAGLRSFAADVRQQALRPAAYAAAKVLYDEMLVRVPVYEGPVPVSKNGIAKIKPGQLRDSIYHYFVEDRSDPGRVIYAIGPNKRKAPHWHLLEYGTVKMAAQPYIRPTYDAKIEQAMTAAGFRLAEKIQELR